MVLWLYEEYRTISLLIVEASTVPQTSAQTPKPHLTWPLCGGCLAHADDELALVHAARVVHVDLPFARPCATLGHVGYAAKEILTYVLFGLVSAMFKAFGGPYRGYA